MAECKDCIHFVVCSPYTAPNESFPEVGGCTAFKNKADVVEVVRCKDCERCFKKRTKRNKQLMLFCMRMDGREYQVNAHDFCSYGVRKGDNK